MEKDASEQQKNDDTAVDQPKLKPGATTPFRYTKVTHGSTASPKTVLCKDLLLNNWTVFLFQEELLDIKELPISNERPECLSEKYDKYEHLIVHLQTSRQIDIFVFVVYLQTLISLISF